MQVYNEIGGKAGLVLLACELVCLSPAKTNERRVERRYVES